MKEIPRSVSAPNLSSKAVHALTELCFRENRPIEKADILFVFGSKSNRVDIAEEIKNNITVGHTSKIMISGGINVTPETAILIPEAKLILDLVNPGDFSGVNFYTEQESKNNSENITNSLKILDFRDYKKIAFIHKFHSAGRAYLGLRKFIPDAEFIQRAVVSNDCDPTTWMNNEKSRNIVWGEFLRIQKYGEKGDIFYDKETADMVGYIVSNTVF